MYFCIHTQGQMNKLFLELNFSTTSFIWPLLCILVYKHHIFTPLSGMHFHTIHHVDIAVCEPVMELLGRAALHAEEFFFIDLHRKIFCAMNSSFNQSFICKLAICPQIMLIIYAPCVCWWITKGSHFAKWYAGTPAIFKSFYCTEAFYFQVTCFTYI